MAGAHAVVIGGCDLRLCGGRVVRLPAASTSSAGLSSSLVGGWEGRRWRPQAVRSKKKQGKNRGVILDGLGGQYQEGFDDIHVQLVNSFTYKAVRTVLHQLYEMNPPNYILFYNFLSNNEVNDGALFLRSLGKEHQELAERVMVTRLHLYGKWIKKCDHAKMYQ